MVLPLTEVTSSDRSGRLHARGDFGSGDQHQQSRAWSTESGVFEADRQPNAAERLEAVRNRIERARLRFGPPPEAVTLVAVSKTFDQDTIRPFLDGGQRVFG